MPRPLALLFWILLCFTAAAGGGFVMTGDWYAMLSKPTWNPPSWVFGPVWTVLYIMMGVSVWLVWKEGGFARQRRPMTLFLVQLVLNAIWTPLFFGMHMLGTAFAEIILLWLAILATILAFRRVSSTAAWLLVPYLLWVSFATVLNGTLWRMN
ncbi:MAG: tryptophan-rich sensory protein [Candidatus Kapabacteria bacterium]|nr:tryptophan-rich sensory protein [Candidatus Kapabacteria bacterium]